MRCLYLLLLCTPLVGQNLIETYRFTDIRNNRVLQMPVVDTDQVEGYELLYATPGTGDIAEIAGHLLLRVHLKDVPEDQDLVISFLADTGERPKVGGEEAALSDCRNRNWFNLIQSHSPAGENPWDSIFQSIRGLTGGFPVTMDIQTLAYTIKSYTVEQDRNLVRYRLLLNDDQRSNLTDYLISLKDQKPSTYYFFHQNCGSVLVQVIGKGIRKKEIADFRPWVSPPHSLCALLIREGLAERVIPNFFSTRAQGDIYRTFFKNTYPLWVQNHSELPWPTLEDFLDSDVQTRVIAIRQLEAVAFEDPNQVPLLLAMGPLVQQMELSTDVRSGHCRDLTSEATAAARELQGKLMETYPDQQPLELIEFSNIIQSPAPPKHRSNHTRLFAIETGAVWLDNRGGASLSGVLLQQEMGSRSALAMQRAGALILGRADLVFNKDGLEEWGFTGLSLKKFRERSGRVASGLRSSQGWGMGLKALELNQHSIGPDLQGRLAGVSGWINIISAHDHQQYLLVGTGLDAGWSHDSLTDTDWGVFLPVGTESLISIGSLQWRTSVFWTANSIQDAPIETSLRSGITMPLGEWGSTEVILHCTIDSLWSGDDDRLISRLSLEFNRW